MQNPRIALFERIGIGLAFLLYPLLSGFAFAVHPNLLSLDVGGAISDKVAEFHGNPLMHLGHFLMFLGVPLLIVIALRFMKLLRVQGSWWGSVGGLMAIFGAVLLAVDKTALCLVMSAFESVPESEYVALLPGIEALFGFQGYIAVLYLLPLLPLGFLILGIGLFKAGVVPRWLSLSLIVAMLGLGVATAVDIDIFGLVATAILAMGFLPYGIRIIKNNTTGTPVTREPGS